MTCTAAFDPALDRQSSLLVFQHSGTSRRFHRRTGPERHHFAASDSLAKRQKFEEPGSQAEPSRQSTRLLQRMLQVLETHPYSKENPAFLAEIFDTKVGFPGSISTGAGAGQSLAATGAQQLNSALSQLQSQIERLLELLARNTLPDVPDYCKDQSSAEFLQQVVTLAHKLCFTTFAPPGYVQGQTALRHFRPPAPQEWQLHATKLHSFARREQARSAAAQRGASAAEQQQAAAAVAGAEGADRVAWAAGQPMPKEDMPEVLHAPEMPAEQPEAAKPAPRTVLMDFVLNPGGSDDEDVEEDFSSSEEE